jgi:Ala-tRNA(Pro) deacylase
MLESRRWSGSIHRRQPVLAHWADQNPPVEEVTVVSQAITCKDRLEQYLREQQITFELQHHPLAYTAQEVAASEHVPGKELAKTVIVITDDRSVMVVVPATRNIQVSRLGGALGASQARLAQEKEFEALFPDCEVGAMPPFGNLYGMDVYVDRSLGEDERILFRAGTHTDTMRIKYADFARLVNPIVVDVAYRAP